MYYKLYLKIPIFWCRLYKINVLHLKKWGFYGGFGYLYELIYMNYGFESVLKRCSTCTARLNINIINYYNIIMCIKFHRIGYVQFLSFSDMLNTLSLGF